ncbi:MAG: transporter [Steroidobacteraceae bacterium]
MEFETMYASLPTRLRAVACCILLAVGVNQAALADTAIETETAQIGQKGEWNFSQAYEYESAKDGTGQGTLTQFEYGITDRSELLIEPFFYVKVSPDGEKSVSGMGDLEITPSYMIIKEHGWVPATLLALKFKVPTGSTNVDSSGKWDYYPYVILGQHYAGWTFNANAGENFAGNEHGGGFTSNFVWDIEAEREVLPNLTWFVEAFSSEDGVPTGSTSMEYQFTEHFNAFVVYSYTSEHSNIGRIGFNIGFGGPPPPTMAPTAPR